MAAPSSPPFPTAFTSKLRPLEAEAAFSRLKVLFTAAPVLSRKDPARPFTVEVDALVGGVGAVLS